MRYVYLLIISGLLLSSQTFQGALRGRISDPAGATIPLVRVVATDENTGVSRTTVTTNQGEYAFASLTPATYSIVAEAPGFKRLERRGIVVATQSSVTADLAMELGEVTEQVNVTEEVPLLETGSASTGQVIDRQKLIDLPNLGRNPFMLSKFSEAVVQVGNPKFNRMQDQSGSSQISIAGGPVRGNNYLLDGIAITDSTNRAVIIPSVEAVGEVKVQANTYDAEMGRTGGGTFNTFLRSGSNDVQGSAFGYLRQTEWLANNFFSNRAGQPRIDQPFRNYGGSIGGPVRIPKVYDGRNRTFFWITGEAYRQTEAAGTRLSIPTAQERTGDFSQSFAPSGSLHLIYDPLNTGSDGTRRPFTGNVIPTSRISTVGANLASYYPQPNVSGVAYGQPNFDATVAAYNRADQTTWKLDHAITDWLRASASYLHYGSREPSNAWFGNIASPGQGILWRKVDATQVNSTITPTPTMVVALRYGFNRFPNFSAPYSFGFNLSTLGLPASLVSQTVNPAFPSIGMTEFANYGGGGTSQSVFHSKSFSVSVAKFFGRHSLKTGFDFRSLHHDGAPSFGPTSFSFSDVFTRATPVQATPGTGSSLAAMLIGAPSGGSMTVASNFFNFVRYYGTFLQDDFRVNSKLTMNFGIRYEFESGPADRNDRFLIGFDPDKPSPFASALPGLTGVPLYAGVNGNGSQAGNPNRNKFSPRVGFAFAPDGKTSIRGGYGVFWAATPFSFQSTLGYSQSTPIVGSFDNNATPATSLENPYPDGLLQPVGNSEGEAAGIGQGLTFFDRDARHGYVQQYSFDMQRQFPAGLVIAAGYIGSRSMQLAQDGRNINQLAPQHLELGSALNQSVANPFYLNGGTLGVGGATITRSQLLRPFPQFTSIALSRSDTNRAIYHAMYMKVQRRFAQGISALATYTWSLNKDMAYGTVGNTFNSAPGSPQDAYQPDAEYGLSAVHTPHRLSMAFTYELPFGQGKALLSSARALDYLVGGWSMNLSSVLQSGFPLAITQLNNNAVIGSSIQRPNATGVSPKTEGALPDRLDGYINPAAFSQAPQFTFGNLSRTISMRGPGQTNFDASVFKTFRIGEKFRAQFRAEALNLTNTPMFYGPNVQLGNPNFGRITSQANFSRMIQLGVRFFL